MRIAAIQSSFIPWRGYFDFIAHVDAFVFLDDVQYTSRDWRNRNKIKTPKGVEWLTVPVLHHSREQLVVDTKIDPNFPWLKKHMKTWAANYGAAPYFKDISHFFSNLAPQEETTISQLNTKLIQRICNYLEIKTPLILSTELKLTGNKTDRLIDLLKKLDADTYLSGPSADAYLDKQAFQRHGIRLEYKTYDYAPYFQQWGGFEGAVTILDLIANCGTESKKHIRSQTKNIIISK